MVYVLGHIMHKIAIVIVIVMSFNVIIIKDDIIASEENIALSSLIDDDLGKVPHCYNGVFPQPTCKSRAIVIVYMHKVFDL